MAVRRPRHLIPILDEIRSLSHQTRLRMVLACLQLTTAADIVAPGILARPFGSRRRRNTAFFREPEGVYFVRFGGNKVKLTLELLTMSDMLETTGNEYKIWRIFDMAEERDKWMD